MILNFGKIFSSYNIHCCCLLIIMVISIALVSIFFQNLSFSQSTNNNDTQNLQTIKTDTSENFVIPFNDTNSERRNPLQYIFDEPKSSNWIVSIYNNLSYYDGPDSKTIIKLQEMPPSEKFVELMLFGNQSKRFIVSVNTNETGYIRMYENNENGWSTDGPVIVSHANVQGLTVTNGKRIVLDNLGMEGFDVGSISVYGKEDSSSLDSTFAGSVQFQVLSGDYSQSALYFMPVIMVAGVGGVVIGLLIWKKRR